MNTQEHVMISDDLPGGNIRVLKTEGSGALLGVDLRDTSTDWFYWCFKAVFPHPGRYRFSFDSPDKIGTRGPAVSTNSGREWKWLGAGSSDGTGFNYDAAEGSREAWFCMGLQYLQSDFDRFAGEFAGNPAFSRRRLCVSSAKGRPVEYVVAGNPSAAAHKIFLTARHHAGEMMANHAMEGFLRAVLSDDAFGAGFRQETAVYAVPFVDKDGVEDGDQGKNRRPHDHNRDYNDVPLYSETAAVMRLLDDVRPDVVIDMHCPWIKGGSNEDISLIGSSLPDTQREIDAFGDLLESVSTPDAPYRRSGDVPYGTAWNNLSPNSPTRSFACYSSMMDYVACAFTIEIPFANFGNVTADRSGAMSLGVNMAHAAALYFRRMRKGRTQEMNAF